MEAKFFKTAGLFREWLEKHHDKENELWVGYFKKATKIKSITWPESVDEALCYGWIDGLRKRIDEKTYKIRFTPRKQNSHWSAVNISRVKELKKAVKMTPAGLKAFHRRKESNSKKAAFEQKNVKLSLKFERLFKTNTKAYTYFETKSPSYKKQCIWWVMSAKQNSTRERRLNILIESSREEKIIPPLRWTVKKKS
jgi:uncharacterized protein YdeI (YjbR/CyaY-like superfamily)